MQVDHVLILAAGKGTRMGELGKIRPKVIWPLFDKSIIELEYLYAKQLAPKAKIFVNVYNYKEKVIEHLNELNLSDLNIVIEEDEIDIGGAIHNIAKNLGYKGNLLILNSDQFILIDPKDMERALEKLKLVDSLLFTYKVNTSDGYNALDLEDDLLKGIISNKDLETDLMIDTYSGMSLIKLDKLNPSHGKSKFFESVCSPQLNKVKVSALEQFEYWDFGTLDRYKNNILKVFENVHTDGKFISFLKHNNALDDNFISKNGYRASNCLNFSMREVSSDMEGILIPEGII